jgi:Protein of unknown function (DUF3224)
MIQHATGTFEVSMTPSDSPQERTVGTLGRMLLDKKFAGDLVASSQGQMLTAMTPTKGSAGYVAIELVTGTLGGRIGSFVLQHSGTMDRGAPLLLVTVVPDSGTGALVGITGQLTIRVADGKHFYTLDYTLPA